MFEDFLDALDDDEFEEQPADLETFLYDKNFLGLPRLSAIQEDVVTRGSQIYKKETLIKLFGQAKGEETWGKTTKDVHLLLGKGSGKDFKSQIICLYAVHKLLCLKDPAAYFGKPDGDSIDIVNMALNANQAKRVFFDGLVTRLKRTPWFAGKYHARQNDVAFDKNINIYSLHSSYEGAEGLNIIIAVLDEIDGFEVEGYSDAMYKALSGTVSSRFSETGKVICLSFPRRKDGFMMRKYNDAVVEKEVQEFTHTFKLNDSLEDGVEGNEFTVTWKEEFITAYKYDNFFALKAPTFRVNPTKHIEDYKMDFYSDLVDTLMRVCANPPENDENGFFKNHAKLEAIFSESNGWDAEVEEVVAKKVEETNYYIHIDLSKYHDRTVVALGHVTHWQQIHLGTLETEPAPFVKIDLFRVWEPSKSNPVDHGEVMAFIIDLCRKFKVELVTFDQWGSANMIEYLNGVGIATEKQSLARAEYQEFALVVGEQRLSGPHDERLLKELRELVVMPNGKVDHPNKGYNDISEAVCGVINNCVHNETEDTSVEVVTLSSLKSQGLQASETRDTLMTPKVMPDNLANWLENMKGI